MSLLNIVNKEKLPVEWKLVEIGDLLSNAQYGTNAKNNFDGDLKIVGMKDIQNGKILTKDLTNTKLTTKEKEKFLLKKGDILINRTNSYDLVGKVGLFNSDIEAVFASYLVRLQIKKELINPFFLNYWLNSYEAKRIIKRIATNAISHANINPTEFKKFFKVPVPPLPEQKAIASLLSVWDEAIEKTERLIEAKEMRFMWLQIELIKKAINHSSTHYVQLGSILNYVQPTKYIVESSDYKDTGLTPVLMANKSFILGFTEEEKGVFTNIPVIIFDDFTTDKKYVNFEFKVKSSAIKILSPKSKEIDLFYVFNTMILINSSIGEHKRHWISEYQFRTIPLPEYKLQQKISNILTAAQNEIEYLKVLLDKYKKQKHGLMQKLLTGKWRVKINEGN